MISRLCVQFAFQLGLLRNCVMVFMTVLNRAPDLLHHPLWKLLHPVLHDQEAIWCQEEFQWSHQWDQEGLREIAELWVTQPLSPCFERICVCVQRVSSWINVSSFVCPAVSAFIGIWPRGFHSWIPVWCYCPLISHSRASYPIGLHWCWVDSGSLMSWH